MVQFPGTWFILVLLSVCALGQSSSSPSQSSTTSSPPPQAQEQQKSVYEPATVLKVTTRLVVVDVVATDRWGRPVTDLKARDFTVLEDGKPQQVRIFNFRQPPTGTTTARKPATLPPNVFTNIPTYNENNSLSVILLDLLNTRFQDQAYARQQALKYLASIHEGEPVTLAVYTMGRKLQLVQPFTSDFAALRKAVNGVKGEHSPVLDNLAGPSPDTPDLVPAQPLLVKELAKVFEGGEQTDLRLAYTLVDLAALARMLSGYPGRKNLIWISATFPLGIGPDADLRTFEFANLRSFEQEVIDVSQSLVDAQIAVYPVDPRGPLGFSLYDGHGTGLSPFGGRGTTSTDQVASLTAETDSGLAEQGTMKFIAKLTGGKAYYDQNNLDDAIRDSIADGSTYYTLAYYPDNKNWNDRFRNIEVKVDRPGVKLRHRSGYYAHNTQAAKDPRQIFTEFGRALNPESPISTGLRFEVGVVQPSEKTENKLLLNFALDPRAVSFAQEGDGLQHAKVDCAVQAYNEKGKLVKTDANTLTLALDPQTYAKAMQSYLLGKVTVDLPAGPYTLRVGVMDEHTGLIGTTSARITVGPSAGPAQDKTDGIKP